MTEAEQRALDKVSNLPIWKAAEGVEFLGGGITNFNVSVWDQGKRYVVRVGEDIVLHQIMRFNEQAVHAAAYAVGIAPTIVHTEPGIMVLDFVEGCTLDEEAIRQDTMLERIVPLLKTCHTDAVRFLRGPILTFWVFHVLRDYAASLKHGRSSYTKILPDLLETADKLERSVGPVQMVLGHNDLLAANFIDDGNRLWLLDWEYGGFNSPLFDLAGLASNNELNERQESWLLETYFETPVTDQLRNRYQAMKCASLLRETMWSMVSEIHSEIDFDYAEYTRKNMSRFYAALSDFKAM